jgi:hypothetical protein
MRTKLAMLVVTALWSIGSAVPVIAHHAFGAEYDATKPITLSGVVTKIEWTNPHARFYMDAKDETGTVVNWNLELASPNSLTRNGWGRNTLKIGDRVTIKGYLAKSGAKMVNPVSVVMADGRALFSEAPSDAPAAAR